MNAAIVDVTEGGVVAFVDDPSHRWTLLEVLDESPVSGGHVLPHLHQVIEQQPGLMRNAEHGVQRGDDRALGAGLAAEGLAPSAVVSYTFVDQAGAQGGVVVPPV